MNLMIYRLTDSLGHCIVVNTTIYSFTPGFTMSLPLYRQYIYLFECKYEKKDELL